jgi:hypothetical protein
MDADVEIPERTGVDGGGGGLQGVGGVTVVKVCSRLSN